ncbi:MAG: class I SAM-dependent methyltransferase [Actinomycetota bacterium]
MILKLNVNQFDDDVQRQGSYLYTKSRLSSVLANSRITRAISTSAQFNEAVVVDIGCGDGTYTFDLARLGAKQVFGLDPSTSAIALAGSRVVSLGLDKQLHFMTGDVYFLPDLPLVPDVVVLRGVLHHVVDQESAIQSASRLGGSMVIVEPNGSNPILKLIERFSKYHRAHEEQSFSLTTIRSWIFAAGLKEVDAQFVGLVPFFCPNWMARTLRILEPFVERIPMIRRFACGQILIVARR